GEGGQHESDHHDDIGDHARNEVVAAIKIGIEPDARAGGDLRNRGLHRSAGTAGRQADVLLAGDQIAGELSNYLAGVARDQGGCVGVRAIDQHLHLGGATTLHVSLEAGQYAHDGLRPATIQDLLYVFFALWHGHDLEAAGAFEAVAQFAAERRTVQVHPGDARVVHVEVDGEAEDDQLHQGRDE